MKKIPIGRAIAHGYRFAFGGFVDLLRLLWLPAAVAAACSYFTGDQMTLFGEGLRTHDFSRLTMPWPLLILLTATSFICVTMQATAAYQLALGKIAAGNRWFYFPLLEKPLWRIVGAGLLLVLTLAALLVVYLLALLLVGFLFGLGFHAAHMSDAAIKTVTTLDTSLAALAGYCGFVFCLVRFGFLLFPATIADGKIGLFGAWQTSHRNFWRMFWTGLAVMLPLIVIDACFLAASGIFRLPPPGATQAQIQAMQTASTVAAEALMHDYWYLFYPGLSLMMILTYGLLAGSQCFAWRALTEDEATNPL